MTNLSKTFDDSFKKEVIDLIKQGLKKELPTGAVYSASKKPPEGAREFTTDRGTKYWIPGKKDKEDSKAGQAKPKASSTPKTGREQFTDKQRAELSNEVDISRKNLSVEAEELHLFTVNDADIYRQRETPIIENLKKKMKKGVYERAKAEKLAKYMFDDASKKYDNSTSGHTFSPDERREAAAHWVKYFEDNYAFGAYD